MNDNSPEQDSPAPSAEQPATEFPAVSAAEDAMSAVDYRPAEENGVHDDNLAIDVRNVSFLFKQHRALDAVRFQVRTGSLHGFVGPNGAGKTTTLKILCTLLKPQAGLASVFGHNVAVFPLVVRRRIGFMPDQFSMYRQMTVFEYLDFFGAAYGMPAAQRERVIGEVLDLTDMNRRRDNLIRGLSRGMQQRVSLARVLVNDPDLLLLDEPASGLDPRARIELMEILKVLQQMGKTIFISSHILSELAELCDSVTIIDRGQVKYTGSMQELATGGSVTPRYVLALAADAAETADRLRNIPGVAEVSRAEDKPVYRITLDDFADTTTNELLAGILALGHPVISFTEDRRHLNQAFLDLTEQGVR